MTGPGANRAAGSRSSGTYKKFMPAALITISLSSAYVLMMEEGKALGFTEAWDVKVEILFS